MGIKVRTDPVRNGNKVRAERRCGELLRTTERNRGGDPKTLSTPYADGRGALRDMPTLPAISKESGTPTLSQIGITRDQSSRWQQLAGMSGASQHAPSSVDAPLLCGCGVLGVRSAKQRGTEQVSWHAANQCKATLARQHGKLPVINVVRSTQV